MTGHSHKKLTWKTVGSLSLATVIACQPAAPAHAPPPQKPEPPSTTEAAPPPAPLPNEDLIAETFVWEQRIHAQHGENSGTFDAVLQHADGELMVVGLTPFHTKLFVIRQNGTEFTFEKFVDQELPFDARNILIDIHRIFLTPFPNPLPSSGSTNVQKGNEIWRDTWQNGRLTFRQIERPFTAKPIAIDYGAGFGPSAPPAKIDYKNGWYGYSLTIETLSATPL